MFGFLIVSPLSVFLLAVLSAFPARTLVSSVLLQPKTNLPPVKFGFDLLNSLVFFPRPPTSSRKDSGNLVWNHLKFFHSSLTSFLPGTGWKWAKLLGLQHCPITKDACSECATLQETGCPPVVLSVRFSQLYPAVTGPATLMQTGTFLWGTPGRREQEAQ